MVEKESLELMSSGVLSLIESNRQMSRFPIPRELEGFETRENGDRSVTFICRSNGRLYSEITVRKVIQFNWYPYLVGTSIELVPRLSFSSYDGCGDAPEEKNPEAALMKMFGIKPIYIDLSELIVKMPRVPWMLDEDNKMPCFCLASEAEKMFEILDLEKEKIRKQIEKSKK